MNNKNRQEGEALLLILKQAGLLLGDVRASPDLALQKNS